MSKTEKLLVYLMATVAPLVFFTDLTRNPYYFQIVFLNAATVALWILFLWRSLKSGRIVFKTASADAPILIFFCYAAFTWLFNLWVVRSDEFLAYSSYAEGLRRWLFSLTNAVLVYYIPVNFSDEDFLRRARFLFFLSGFVAAVYGIMQFLGFEMIWSTQLNPFGGRSVSTFGNPNFLSSFLVMLLPMLLALYMNASGGLALVAAFVGLTAYAVSLIVTLTRSSWGGVAAAVAVFLAFAGGMSVIRRFRRRLSVLAAAGVVAVLLWPHPTSSHKYVPAVYGRFTEMKSARAGEVYGPLHQRLLIWSCAWNMTSDHPVVGRGWGLFELYYPYYQGKYLFIKTYRDLRTHANNAHNEILEILSQTGIVGMGLYLWMIASIFAAGAALVRSRPPDGSYRRLMPAAMLGGIAGMLVDNLANVSLHFAVPAFLYWWLVGSVSAGAGSSVREWRVNTNPRRAVVAALMLAGALLIVKYYRNFLGEINYFSGFKLSKRGDVAGALPYLEKAHRYQRFEVNNNYELANTYARLGRRDEALKAYKEALRANAGYDEIFFNMATVYNQSGMRDEALEYYSEALAINPLSRDAYAAVGGIYFADIGNARNVDSAAALFERALHYSPESPDILNNLGYLYTKKGDASRAAAYYTKALEIDPDFALARRNLENLGKTAGVKISAGAFENRLRRIESLAADGNFDAARRAALETSLRHPGSFRAKFYLGNVYFSSGDYAGAAAVYEELLAAGKENVSLRINLALSYERLDRGQAAAAQWREVLRLDPSNRTAAERLGAGR